MMRLAFHPIPALAALAFLLVLLALVRPLDHDESQYVAAAVLAQTGLPYRDFAYLQTPLQPLLFAPLAGLFGAWSWPGLRLVNALLGAVAVAGVYRAAREGGAGERPALGAAGLFAVCDILLFSVGTARNDALPVALLASALPLVMRVARERGSNLEAVLVGLLLASAAAAKISYALPAAAYGLYALFDRRHRPVCVALGAAPVVVLVVALAAAAPQGFWFGVIDFPARAPDQYYHDAGRAWKLGVLAKAFDTLKFLALGPALLALVLMRRFRWRGGSGRAIDWLIVAGLIAALLPSPTWRQYLLPLLPPLFVRLGLGWHIAPPGRKTRIAAIVFACAGLAPSVEAITRGAPLIEAMRQGRAVGVALDQAGVQGEVATLAPQFLPAARRTPDPRFAAGPFYFRSTGLVAPGEETRLHLVSRATLADQFTARPPGAILVGGEGKWTSGDPALDTVLENWARARGWRRIDVPGGRFRLYLRPV